MGGPAYGDIVSPNSNKDNLGAVSIVVFVLPCTVCYTGQVGSAGGIMAILRGMAAFRLDADIQGEACTAVTNLSHNCDRNRRHVVEGGGLVLILNAMQVQ